MSTYYLRQRTRISGPFSAEQVKALLHRGRIARSDKVSTDRTTWRSIAETPELIERPRPVEPEPAEPAAEEKAADTRIWYYTLGGAQQASGIDTAALGQLVASGQLGPGEMVWTDGFAEWQPVGSVPEFAAAAGPAPGFPPADGFPPVQGGQPFEFPMDLPPIARKKGWF